MGFRVLWGGSTGWKGFPNPGAEDGDPSPGALTSPRRWGLPRPGRLAGPSSGFGRPASHGLASGRGEDKAQGFSSSGIKFKTFTANMAKTLTNQNGPKAPCCAKSESFHHWMVGCSGDPRREVSVS